ncbi:hypothetical protein Lsan_3792 [Legionella santicrucis]|uniref:Uncharacterized protein n=1 Tax=Legionella santicrucis TaxID=45074 RepID=A0A0W0Y9W5_9GAMM|nr:hypothetical protein [Legionella santicrucis]KTD53382.1 hypothetical protein Lsan_3792 [Legionella santicrucis]
MSKNSTSTMLGKLAVGQNESCSETVLGQKSEEVGETFAVPQLKPSKKPKMEEVLTNILGAAFSKGYSPMDKN